MKEKIPVKPILITVSCLFLMYTLAGVLLVPVGVKKALEAAVDKTIAGTVSAESVRFNPYTLEGRIQGMDVRTRAGGPLASVDQVYVNISAASLFKLAPVIDAVRVEGPKIVLATDRNGKLTVAAVETEKEVKNTPGDGIFGFCLANLAISGGELSFTDGGRGVTHHVQGFSLAVPLISTLEDEISGPVSVTAGGVVNDAKINATATVYPFGPDINGKVHVQGTGMALKPYLAYVPLPSALELTEPGILSWDMDIKIALPETRDMDKAKVSIQGTAGIKAVAADLRDEGPLVRLAKLGVTLDTKDLISQGLELGMIRMDQPEIFLERDSSGALPALAVLNIGQKGSEKRSHASPAPKAVSLSLARAEVTGGKVHIKDRVPDKGFQTLLSPVSIQVENLSFRNGNLGLAAKGQVVTPAGETLVLTARLAQKQGDTLIDGRITLENGYPAAYAAYLTRFTKDRVAVERIDVSSDFSLETGPEGVSVTTRSGALTLAGFRLGPQKETAIIDLPRASMTGVETDLAGRKLTIGSVAAPEAKMNIEIDDQGRINFVEELAPLMPEAETQTGKTQQAPWQVFLGELGLAQWQVAFRDDSHGRDPVQVALSDITLSANDLTTAPKASPGRIKGGMTIQNAGQFNWEGTLDLARKKARLGLKLKDIGINTFEPYFTKYLKIEIANGRFGADTTLDLFFPGGKKPVLRLSGKAGIMDFSSKDKLTQSDFFRCQSLFVSGMDISLWPVQVGIKDLSLTDFYSRAILLEDGRLNLKTILADSDEDKSAPPVPESEDTTEPEKTQAPPKEVPQIQISNITLQGGHINFTDQFTQPSYTANMTQVAGRITNLSSRAQKPADLVLKGVHGQYSPLDITGKLQPFGQDRMVDMTLSFKNIELTQFNAYAEKYLGYGIETGKLMLTLAYHIRGNQLESSNQLFFDQLNLGNKVVNDTATGLPVQLAISLLKNSKDQIDLDIPVHGDLNDPAFRYGSVVATAFKNLILSVVSAPFKLLGKAFGAFDSGELGYVEFDPGKDSLDDEDQAKLDSIGKILSEKETLKFVIECKYDPELDAAALRTGKYESALLAQVKETKKNKPSILEDAEKRMALVQHLYAAAAFPKPRDEQGNEKHISSQEMEKLLLTNTAVTDADLADLAARRGNRIMAYLADQGSLSPNRLYLRSPGPVPEEDQKSRKVKTIFKLE